MRRFIQVMIILLLGVTINSCCERPTINFNKRVLFDKTERLVDGNTHYTLVFYGDYKDMDVTYGEYIKHDKFDTVYFVKFLHYYRDIVTKDYYYYIYDSINNNKKTYNGEHVGYNKTVYQ